MATIAPARSAGLLLSALLLGASGSVGLGQGSSDKPTPDIAPKPESSAANAGYIGLSVDEVPPAVRAQTTLEDGFGLSVVFVVPGGPSDNAGVRRYDILTAFDEQRLAEPGTLKKLAAAKSPGDQVTLTVLRRGAAQEIVVTIGDVRDAPEGLIADDAQKTSAPVESLLQLFGFGRTSDHQPSDWSDSISALLGDLRKRSGTTGITLQTLGALQHVHISTSEMDIVIIDQGKDGAPWISAKGKDGENVFTGLLSRDTPPALRRIIEELRSSECLPILEPSESRNGMPRID
ncbi:MAG: PDZ domain-containing protein [Verrucomicrobiales bacterium]